MLREVSEWFQSAVGRCVYALVRVSFRGCFRLFGRMVVCGREHMPMQGALIVVVNHLSNNDAPVLAVALPRLPDWLGKIELFQNPISRKLMEWGRVHPVNRSVMSPSQLRNLLKLLKEDRCLLIFAEGTRSNGSMTEAKPGAAFLAFMAGVPVLPVAIHGTEKWPFWRVLFPWCRFTVDIGAPFILRKQDGESLQDMQDRIMYRIAKLLPPEYQGVYSVESAQL